MNYKLRKILIVEEIRNLFNNKLLLTITFILPVITTVIYGLIYSKEVTEELPVAVVDFDNSVLSNKLLNMFESSPSIKLIEQLNSVEEIKEEMMSGKIEGGIVIPSNFSKGLKKGNFQTITFYKNSQNIISSNLLLKEAATITQTFSAGVLLKKLKSSQLTQDKAMNIVNPIRIHTNSLFNPNYSYLNYLVPGLALFTIQMASMLSGGFLFNKKNSKESIFTRFAVYFVWNVIVALTIFLILFPALHIRFAAEPLYAFVLTSFYLFVVMLIGLAISVYAKEELTAIEVILFINTPAFIFSGFTFPIWGMPKVHSIYAQIIPFTHFLEAYLRVGIMSAPINAILNQILILAGFAVLSLLAIFIKVRLNSGEIISAEENNREELYETF